MNGTLLSAGDFPYTQDPRYTITRTNIVRLTVDFGLTVKSNGWYRVSVLITDHYKDQIEGICGNYDDNKQNDWLQNADIYKVDDPELPQ